MEIKTLEKRQNKSTDSNKAKEILEKLRKEHNKMVKGKFEFLDAQGGWIEFTYRFFPEDMLVNYKFVHGETCEIPMGLVKHINNTTKKVRKFGHDVGSTRGNELKPGDRGVPSSFETTSRIRFTPIDMF